MERQPIKLYPILLTLSALAALCAIITWIATPRAPSPPRVVATRIPTRRPTSVFDVPPEVYYVVEGTASSVSITLINAQGGTEQDDVPVPYKQQVRLDWGDFAFISAQNRGERGSVTCQILVNGDVWRESTSSGAYKIATCSGAVGID